MRCYAVRNGKKRRSKMQMILFGRSRALLTGNLEPWQLCFDVDVGAWNLWGTMRDAWVGLRWPGNNSQLRMAPRSTLPPPTNSHHITEEYTDTPL